MAGTQAVHLLDRFSISLRLATVLALGFSYTNPFCLPVAGSALRKYSRELVSPSWAVFRPY